MTDRCSLCSPRNNALPLLLGVHEFNVGLLDVVDPESELACDAMFALVLVVPCLICPTLHWNLGVIALVVCRLKLMTGSCFLVTERNLLAVTRSSMLWTWVLGVLRR